MKRTLNIIKNSKKILYAIALVLSAGIIIALIAHNGWLALGLFIVLVLYARKFNDVSEIAVADMRNDKSLSSYIKSFCIKLLPYVIGILIAVIIATFR